MPWVIPGISDPFGRNQGSITPASVTVTVPAINTATHSRQRVYCFILTYISQQHICYWQTKATEKRMRYRVSRDASIGYQKCRI